MTMSDDWADLEAATQAAMRETEALLERDPARSIADPSLPIYQLAAIEKLELERRAFEAGDKLALLGAIRVCANHDVVMPEWVATNFIRAYDRVLHTKVGSLDDAFGRPYNGKWMERRRKVRDSNIAAEIKKVMTEGAPVTRAQAKIAARYNVSTKTVENIWYRDSRKPKST